MSFNEMTVPHAGEKQASIPAAESARAKVVRIAPSTGWVSLELGELWERRELLYFLVWRDVIVRYKQTLLGAAWAILQPLLTTVIFSVVFGRLAHMPSDGIPYPLFSLSALVPWTFFAASTARASDSLVGNTGIVKKVYFPRLAVPIARVLACFADFIPGFAILLIMMLYYGSIPGLHILWVPFFVGLAAVTALGIGFWLAALNARYRDIGYVTPFLVQCWFFVTPVIYPSTLLPPSWQVLYSLNPMVGSIDGIRWALLGTKAVSGPAFAASCLVAALLFFSGVFFFRRMDREFADIL
jgi:lipopolysaccharide transport system permease protein